MNAANGRKAAVNGRKAAGESALSGLAFVLCLRMRGCAV
jgi:hypothetical protein